MRKAFIVLALIVSLLGAGWAGHYKGYEDANYRMAWTNVRACILAVDSSLMRVLSTPIPEALSELGARYGACEQHWELLYQYSPDDDDEYRNIDEARWMFNNWGLQIRHAVELRVESLKVLNSEEEGDTQLMELCKSTLKEQVESEKFRDHIERELFEAW